MSINAFGDASTSPSSIDWPLAAIFITVALSILKLIRDILINNKHNKVDNPTIPLDSMVLKEDIMVEIELIRSTMVTEHTELKNELTNLIDKETTTRKESIDLLFKRVNSLFTKTELIAQLDIKIENLKELMDTSKETVTDSNKDRKNDIANINANLSDLRSDLHDEVSTIKNLIWKWVSDK